jgi:hypothetical protein
VAIAAYGFGAYAVLLPLLTMILVLRDARLDGWDDAYEKYSFLIRGLRLKFWFWEFVVLFRKVLIRLLIALVVDPTLQALLGIWALTSLFVLQTFVKPYVLPVHNHAEQVSLMTAILTLNIGLAFRSLTTNCGVVCQGFSVFLVVINGCAFLFFFYQIFVALYDRVVEEFGVDTATGKRQMSIRNIRNALWVVLQRQYELSPSFRTYEPKFVDPALARCIFGSDDLKVIEELRCNGGSLHKRTSSTATTVAAAPPPRVDYTIDEPSRSGPPSLVKEDADENAGILGAFQKIWDSAQ